MNLYYVLLNYLFPLQNDGFLLLNHRCFLGGNVRKKIKELFRRSLFYMFVEKIFLFHGLTIFDVDEIPTHGGSLRIYIKHSENKNISIHERVSILLGKEKGEGLENISTYTNFIKSVNEIKKQLQEFVNDAKNSGKKIVCYGAAAKGNTLLNYCKIENNFIDYVVDQNPHKQGLFLPGTHIPIKNPDEIKKTKPDYLIIIPWNLKNEIMEEMKIIRNWGGKFVIPIPEVTIL